MKASYQYDVALSFAGENREYVEAVATSLKHAGIKVFYDLYEQIDLWGKDLYTHLRKIYQYEARFTVLFISEHYAQKLWTNHERQSAQARAFTENAEYILPVRFDDTEVAGVLPTIGYLDLRHITAAELASAIVSKLERSGELAKDTKGNPSEYSFVAPSDGPVIVWRMPRGFLLLEDIVQESSESWAVRIEHYGYDGEDRYGTHYHESYGKYWDMVGGEGNQYRKLQIPRGDWYFGNGALNLARDIRHRRIIIDHQGVVTRDGNPYMLHADHVSIYASGVVPRQYVPPSYRVLAKSGALRDLIAEIREITSPFQTKSKPAPEDLLDTSKGIRRLVRLEISKLFAQNHPARINVDEVIEVFSRGWSEPETIKWLWELASALGEAVDVIQHESEPGEI